MPPFGWAENGGPPPVLEEPRWKRFDRAACVMEPRRLAGPPPLPPAGELSEDMALKVGQGGRKDVCDNERGISERAGVVMSCELVVMCVRWRQDSANGG